MFRFGGPVALGSGRHPGLWLLSLALATAALLARRRSAARRAALAGILALLPLALATADPVPQAATPRDCGLPNCRALAQISDPSQTSHMDSLVQPGASYDYFVRVVNQCEEYSDTPPIPVEIPVPSPTPGPSPTAKPTTAVPPSPTSGNPPTSTPVEPEPTATTTRTPTPKVTVFPFLTIGPSNLDSNPKKITDLIKDDQVSITEVAGLLTFNTDPSCDPQQASYQVDANGLSLDAYNDGVLSPVCYGNDHTCSDPMPNDPHAGLYMKLNGSRTFVGRNGHSFTAPASGALYLAINDCTAGAPAPNLGSFSVKVTVIRARR